jgi:UDP-N-acetylmuramoyl-tripeptide--D-alanyl-D-alanine ligase
MCAGAEVIGFGANREATVRLVDCVLDASGSTVEAALPDLLLCFRLPVPGRHWVMNALAVLAAVQAAGADVRRGAEALAGFEALPGRGRRREIAWRAGTLILIDESYNASPAAMRAALAVLAVTEPAAGAGALRCSGTCSSSATRPECLHRELAEPLAAAKVDRVFLVGEAMAALHRALPEGVGRIVASADDAIPALLRFLEPGDVVTICPAACVSRIVERLCAPSAQPET